jgi:hypothetical protein
MSLIRETLDVRTDQWLVVTVYDKTPEQRIVNVYGPYTSRSRASTLQRRLRREIGDRNASVHVRPLITIVKNHG